MSLIDAFMVVRSISDVSPPIGGRDTTFAYLHHPDMRGFDAPQDRWGAESLSVTEMSPKVWRRILIPGPSL